MDNLAVLQDQNSGAVLQNFGQVIGDDDNAHAGLAGQLLQNGVDIVLGADVNTDGGAVEDQNIGVGCQPLCQNDTLLVTTGQGVGIVVGIGSGNGQILDPLVDGILTNLVIEGAGLGLHVVDLRDNDVVSDGLGQEQALGQTVFGNETDLLCNGFLRSLDGDNLAVAEDLAGSSGLDAEQGQSQLGTAGVQQTGDAQDFAALQFEGDVLVVAGQGQVLDFHDGLLGNLLSLKGLVLEAAAGHVVGELCIVQIGNVAGGDQFAGTDDGETLSNFKDFVQLVADEQNGNAFLLQLLDDLEQSCNFLLGQSRGGLVHDDQLCVEHQSTGNRNHLLFSNGQGADQSIQIDLEVDLGDGFFRDLTHTLLADELTLGGQFGVQGQIFHNRQVGENRKVLINDLNACHDGIDGRELIHHLAVEFQSAAVTGMDAGNDLNQSRLAAAVFAGQAVNFAGHDLQGNTLQSFNTSKMLLDVDGLQ